MSTRVILVGHCSPDSSYLAIAVKAVKPDAVIERAMDDVALLAYMEKGASLLLINRVLDGEYSHDDGVELLASCRKSHPDVPAMLISNYPEAQARAVAAGAVPGFGKSQVTSVKSREMLASALGSYKL